MRKIVVVDLFASLFEIFNNVMNLGGIPVENGVGDKAKATGFVHDGFVIASGKLTLVSKKDASWKPVAVFPFVELDLNGAS